MFEVDLRRSAARERIDPQVGDEVVILGKQGLAEITVDELAGKLMTTPYEITTGFSSLPKVFT
jgi:alanine racemase